MVSYLIIINNYKSQSKVYIRFSKIYIKFSYFFWQNKSIRWYYDIITIRLYIHQYNKSDFWQR